VKQDRDIALWRRHVAALEAAVSAPENVSARSLLATRLAIARKELARATSPAYLGELTGTIGADPFIGQ